MPSCTPHLEPNHFPQRQSRMRRPVFGRRMQSLVGSVIKSALLTQHQPTLMRGLTVPNQHRFRKHVDVWLLLVCVNLHCS